MGYKATGTDPARTIILAKAMELSELGKRLFLTGLRRRFPDADEKQLHAIYLSRVARCHNRNY